MAVLGLSCGMWDLPVSWGIFHYGTQILYLRCKDSVVAAHRLSCSVACGILVPWPGIEPMSFALQGRFLTTGPSGKSLVGTLKGLLWAFYTKQLSILPPQPCGSPPDFLSHCTRAGGTSRPPLPNCPRGQDSPTVLGDTSPGVPRGPQFITYPSAWHGDSYRASIY